MAKTKSAKNPEPKMQNPSVTNESEKFENLKTLNSILIQQANDSKKQVKALTESKECLEKAFSQLECEKKELAKILEKKEAENLKKQVDELIEAKGYLENELKKSEMEKNELTQLLDKQVVLKEVEKESVEKSEEIEKLKGLNELLVKEAKELKNEVEKLKELKEKEKNELKIKLTRSETDKNEIKDELFQVVVKKDGENAKLESLKTLNLKLINEAKERKKEFELVKESKECLEKEKNEIKDELFQLVVWKDSENAKLEGLKTLNLKLVNEAKERKKEFELVKESKECLEKELSRFETEQNELKIKLTRSETEKNEIKDELFQVVVKKDGENAKLESLKTLNLKLINEAKERKKEFELVKESKECLEKENNELKTELTRSETEKNEIKDELFQLVVWKDSENAKLEGLKTLNLKLVNEAKERKKEFELVKESKECLEKELSRFEKEKNELKTELAKLVAEKDSVEKEVDFLKNDRDATERGFKAEFDKIIGKCGKEKAESQRVIDRLKNEIREVEEKGRIENETKKKLEKRVAVMSDLLESVRKEEKKLREKAVEFEREKERDLSELNRVIDGLKREMKEVEEKERVEIEKNKKLEKRVSVMNELLESVRKEEKVLREKAVEFERRESEREMEVERLTKEIEGLVGASKDWDVKIVSLVNEKSKVESELKKALKEVEEQNGKIDELISENIKVAEAKGEVEGEKGVVESELKKALKEIDGLVLDKIKDEEVKGEMEAKNVGLKREIGELKAAISVLEDKYQVKMDEYSALDVEIERAMKESARLVRERDDAKSLVEEKGKLESSLNKALKEIEEQNRKIDELEWEKIKFEEAKGEMEGEMVGFKKEIGELRVAISGLERELTAKKEESKGLCFKVDQSGQEIARLISERDDARKGFQENKGICVTLKEKIAEMEKKIEGTEKKLKEVNSEKNNVLKEKKGLEQKFDVLKSKVASLEGDLLKGTKEIGVLSAKLLKSDYNLGLVLKVVKGIRDGDLCINEDVGEEIRPCVDDLVAIGKEIREGGAKVEEMKKQVEVLDNSVQEADKKDKKKNVFAAISSATAVLAACCAVYANLRGH